MRKKFFIFFLAVFVALFWARVSLAQTALKIGYVSLTKVFDQYKKTVDYDKALEQRSTEYKKQLNDMVAKIQEAERKLTLLKEEDRAKLADQTDKDKEALKEFMQKNETDLRKDRDDKIREILLEIEGVVKDYAQKEKYDIILNDRVLIYGSEPFDLTQKILDLLNTKK